jgi:choloylglycine hydrolase
MLLNKKMKSMVRKAVICLICLQTVLLLGTEIELNESQRQSLRSLRKVDDLLYVMTFYGGYGFKNVFKEGNKPPAHACSSFAASTPEGEKILAHNGDGPQLGPALLLYCHPPDGYASVSDSSFHVLGYSREDCNDLHLSSMEKRIRLLKAPLHPHAGMNERGLAFAEMMAQKGGEAKDPAKSTVDARHLMRLILDYAGTVDEAIALLRKYNNTGSSIEHYLFADASGDSAVVEYQNGEVIVTRRSNEPWLTATNFRILNAEPGRIQYHCRRYKRAYQLLKKYGGNVSVETAMDILEAISVKALEWWNADLNTGGSLVFNMTKLEVDFTAAMQYHNVLRFKLDTPLIAEKFQRKKDFAGRERPKKIFQVNEVVETSESQWKTLQTLRKIDSLPLYVMEYRSDYDFDAFLEKGVETRWYFEPDINEIRGTDDCAVFRVSNKKENRSAAVHLHAPQMPYLVLFTYPSGGFPSVSLVSLGRLGYPATGEGLFDKLDHLLGLLEAPYWPVNGVNVQGLFAAVFPTGGGTKISVPGKVTLDGPHGLRLILDGAKNIDEAAALLKKYNTNASGDYSYFIADASGDWVVLKHSETGMVITRNPQGWHGRSLGNLMDILKSFFSREAMSAVCDLTTGELQVVMGNRYDKVQTFKPGNTTGK